MKKIIVGIIVIILIAFGTTMFINFNNKSNSANNDTDNSIKEDNNMQNSQTNNNENSDKKDNDNINNDNTKETFKIKGTVNGKTLTATLNNNATTRDFIDKLPLTLPMMDLYDREMCYRFDEALSTDNLTSSGYKVGEIAYWPPRHSFVILYEQNGERFERQTLGYFDESVDIFKTTGDTDVLFELID